MKISKSGEAGVVFVNDLFELVDFVDEVVVLLFQLFRPNLESFEVVVHLEDFVDQLLFLP
jgi:hypothetical protein